MIAKRFKYNKRMFQIWIAVYRQYGIKGLQNRRIKTGYTDQFKRKLIMEVLSRRSQGEVWRKHNLPPHSNSLLSVYISGIKTISKESKMTFADCITIVEFVLQHQKGYQHTAETFLISYQQVYEWVRTYELEDKEKLLDCSGQKILSFGKCQRSKV